MTQNKFDQNSENINKHIEKFIEPLKFKNEEFYKKLLESILKIGMNGTEDSDLKIILGFIEEARKTFKVFSKYRDRRKISIFGSSRTKPNDPDYTLTVETSKKLTEKGYMIITGAGPGIMEAGNKGSSHNRSFGLNIELPFEQAANKYIINDPKLISYKYFFTRKLGFIKESDGTVLFPGGYGTLDEAFEALTLIQTGRTAPRPMVFVNKPGSTYWNHWLHYIKKEIGNKGFINEEDLSLIKLATTSDDVVNHIDNFYKVYHSIRYLDEYTVMRVNKDISKKTLNELTNKYKKYLLRGEFECVMAEDVKLDNNIYPDKKRLIFNFNKINYAGISQIIDDLSRLEG